MILEVYLPGIPPGPNKRQHWGDRAKSTKEWRADAFRAAYAAAGGRWRALPICPAEIEYVFLLPHEKGDLDNLIAACKPVLDGIRDARVIVDDSVASLRSIRGIWRKSSEAGVIVRIKEAEG